MGTAVSVDIRCFAKEQAAHKAIDSAFDWLRRVDRIFSTYRDDSEISRLDRGELSLHDCSSEVREVLDACKQLRRSTDGYFDISARGTGIDPSGFVKGWAVEGASARLVETGSTDHCINAGGDVRLRGAPEPGRAWSVGIAHPTHAGSLTTIVTGSDIGIATSGTAERGRHVFDPHTGDAVEALRSVTLVGPDLTYTDAYATAALAMGTGAPDWLGSLPDHEAYVIDAAGYAWWTPGFVRFAPALLDQRTQRLS